MLAASKARQIADKKTAAGFPQRFFLTRFLPIQYGKLITKNPQLFLRLVDAGAGALRHNLARILI
jgi:hypothetical protein